MFDNLYFYSIRTKNISHNITIIRDLCRFLQLGLISLYNISQETSSYCQPQTIYKRIIGLIPNDWKLI